jgi:hypothetical protein
MRLSRNHLSEPHAANDCTRTNVHRVHVALHTFPDVLMPLQMQKNTTIHATNRHNARSILIIPTSSIPDDKPRTLYLKINTNFIPISVSSKAHFQLAYIIYLSFLYWIEICQDNYHYQQSGIIESPGVTLPDLSITAGASLESANNVAPRHYLLTNLGTSDLATRDAVGPFRSIFFHKFRSRHLFPNNPNLWYFQRELSPLHSVRFWHTGMKIMSRQLVWLWCFKFNFINYNLPHNSYRS